MWYDQLIDEWSLYNAKQFPNLGSCWLACVLISQMVSKHWKKQNSWCLMNCPSVLFLVLRDKISLENISPTLGKAIYIIVNTGTQNIFQSTNHRLCKISCQSGRKQFEFFCRSSRKKSSDMQSKQLHIRVYLCFCLQNAVSLFSRVTVTSLVKR